ncbi:hypothetical protein K438DRAFT_1805403, partial [Mycena galopus ATCC 62051]
LRLDIWTLWPSGIVTLPRCPSLGVPLSGHLLTSQLPTSGSGSAPRVLDPAPGLFRRALDISLVKSLSLLCSGCTARTSGTSVRLVSRMWPTAIQARTRYYGLCIVHPLSPLSPRIFLLPRPLFTELSPVVALTLQ